MVRHLSTTRSERRAPDLQPPLYKASRESGIDHAGRCGADGRYYCEYRDDRPAQRRVLHGGREEQRRALDHGARGRTYGRPLHGRRVSIERPGVRQPTVSVLRTPDNDVAVAGRAFVIS